MKNSLTIEIIKHQFKSNDNDKHVEPFFYEDEDGVHLRTTEEITKQGYTAEDFFSIASELAYAGGNIGSPCFSKTHDENLRNNQLALELYQLAFETQKIGLELYTK